MYNGRCFNRIMNKDYGWRAPEKASIKDMVSNTTHYFEKK